MLNTMPCTLSASPSEARDRTAPAICTFVNRLMCAVLGFLLATSSLASQETPPTQLVEDLIAVESLRDQDRGAATATLFEQRYPRHLFEERIQRHLRQQAILESSYDETLSDDVLQRALDRMARNSRRPQRLRQIFAALDDDPRRIAEALVRPHLVKQRLRSLYSSQRNGDGGGDGEALSTATTFDDWLADHPVTSLGPAAPHRVLQLPQIIASGSDEPDAWSRELPEAPQAKQGQSALWTGSELIVWGGRVAGLPSSGLWTNAGYSYDPVTDLWTQIRLDATTPEPRAFHSAVWTGSEMIVWGGESWDESAATPYFVALDSGGAYDPVEDRWTTTPSNGVPSPRMEHTAVWTGSEMVVWGGFVPDAGDATPPPIVPDYIPLDDGARYDPAFGGWTAMGGTPPTARGRAAAVWTGDIMHLVGGFDGNQWLNPTTDSSTFASYDPQTDSWDTSQPQPPSGGMMSPPFEAPIAVWTGETLWVAQPASGRLLAQYRLGTWTEPSAPPSASDRRYTSLVWTGRRLILWGGRSGMPGSATTLDNGLIYDAQTFQWSTVPADLPNSASRRFGHVGFWTGSEMLIWGGGQQPDFDAGPSRPTDLTSDGWRYRPDWNPITDTGSWQSMPLSPRVGSSHHSMVWTGSELILWGGQITAPVATGAIYDPVLDLWSSTSTLGAPIPRSEHSSVWSGSELVVWGGFADGGTPLDDGARYDPVSDTWTATGGTPPAARGRQSTVWTGSEMIVWGGYDGPQRDLANGLLSGGRYDPATDSWLATGGSAPAARGDHRAVWTGEQMLIFGGLTGCPGACQPSAEAAAYDPLSDAWSSPFSAPSGGERWGHGAVWTGEQMIAWGGTTTYDFTNPCLGDGVVIDPVTFSATLLPADGASRCRHSTIWNGSEMIVWGGSDRINLDNGGINPPEETTASGRRLDLQTMTWTATREDAFTPPAVSQHQAVWTGEEMLVWGGKPQISETLGVYTTDTQPTASPSLEIDGGAANEVLLGGGDEEIALGHTLPSSFFDDVEGAVHWTADESAPLGVGASPWHISFAGTCSDGGDSTSPLSAWRFGNVGSCDYSGAAGTFTLTSDDHFTFTDTSQLELRYLLHTDRVGDSAEQDLARIEASDDDGDTWTVIALDSTHQADALGNFAGTTPPVPLDDRGERWRGLSIALASYVGNSAEGRIRFVFERQGSLNDRLGWLLDDISVGEPAGDGRLPGGVLVASDGSRAEHLVAAHDRWDRPSFSWDLDGDGTADNPDPSRPHFILSESDLSTYQLDTPGSHDLSLTVSDRNGNQQSAVVSLAVVDGEAPTVELLQPNGGEAWPAGSRQTITWSAEDNIALAGFDLVWFDDEAGSGPQTVTCDEPLDADSRVCVWTLPETTSTAARVEITARDQRPEPGGPNTASDASDAPFYLIQANSDAIRTLLVWHGERFESLYGAADKAALQAALVSFASHPKIDGQVLDLANVPSLAPLYAAWDDTAWGTGSAADQDDNIAQANALATAIRIYLFEQIAQSFTQLESMILVGGDPLLPMWRMAEDLPRYPESRYIEELQSFGMLDDASSPAAFCDETESPLMAAMCRDHYLADGPYGASASTIVPGSSFSWFLPDIALGRLVETPDQIMGLIDVFIAQDGVTHVDRAMSSGYDFLTDGGDAIFGRLQEELDLGSTTLDRLSQSDGLWSDDDLLDLLFGNGPQDASDLSFIVGHADHRAEGAAQVGDAGVLTTLEMEASLRSNRGGVVIGVGCHSALPVQADGGATDETSAAFLLDLPEIMAERSFPVLIGNGGFGWAFSEGVGLGEQLLVLVADELLRAGQLSAGEALRLAKQEYFLRQDRLDAFDHKVIHEAMLFGIPNYEVRLDMAADSEAALESSWSLLDGPRSERDAIRAHGPRVPGRPWLGDPDWSHWTLPSGAVARKSQPRAVVANPDSLGAIAKGGSNLQILDFSFQAYEAGQDTDDDPATADWQEAYQQFDWCSDLDGESVLCSGAVDESNLGTFFTINRLASNESGRPIQPMISFDSRLFGTELHGILIRGGEFLQPDAINPQDAQRCTDTLGTVHRCYDPIIGNPESEVDELEGPAPTPFVVYDAPTPFVVYDAPTSNGFFENGAGDPIRFDTLNAPMGSAVRRGVRLDENDARQEIFSQWLYRTRDFTNYYSNSSDWTPPDIGAFTADCSSEIDGADCYHTVADEQATLTVPVDDLGDGVHRVFVTFTRDVDVDGRGAWTTQELPPVAAGVYGAVLPSDRRTTYLIQAVDWAGNIGTVRISGDDVDAEGNPIGSTFDLPQVFTIEPEAQGEPPLFADGFESGDLSRWSTD